MKHFYLLLIVILISLVGISLIARQGIGDDSPPENMAQASSYEVTGNQTGQVIVKDKVSGRVIRRFQIEKGVIREVFLLDGGKTVSASQKDSTVFWDLDTGREIQRFEQRIYGFSHDKTKFFTYSPQGVLLYSYPEMKPVCELAKGLMVGPEKFLFSSDDGFLAILFATGRPESDEYYPGTGPVRRSIRYSKLFNIKTCREIQEFSQLKVSQLGEFSKDSKSYTLDNYAIFIENRYVKGSWRFDLTTNKLQKFFE
jgi:hypothetical protein